MTDQELIERLRLLNEVDANAAADRIEELMVESGRRLALARFEGVARVDQFERAEALEAKLAKTVEALRDIIDTGGRFGTVSHMSNIDRIARAALAELEGK